MKVVRLPAFGMCPKMRRTFPALRRRGGRAKTGRAQPILRGRIFDSTDSSALSYAAVGIEGKRVGVLTDSSGNFAFPLSDTVSLDDSLTFSLVGYEPAKRRIAESFGSDTLVVGLQRKNYGIAETVVLPGKTRRVRMGRSKVNTVFGTNFFDGPDPVGKECGMLLESKYDCRVSRLNFYIGRNGFEHALFRLTFYTVDDRPAVPVTDKDIRFEINDRRDGWIGLDLNAADIRLKPGKFAVTLTLLEYSGADEARKGLEMPIAVPARRGVITKDHVQGHWYRDSMAVSLFVEAAAYVGR